MRSGSGAVLWNRRGGYLSLVRHLEATGSDLHIEHAMAGEWIEGVVVMMK
jgi:hypothetical protein